MITWKRAVIAILGTGCLLPATISRAEVYNVGSIQGQNSWSGGTVPIVSTIDQEVTEAAAHTGKQSWHISNSTIDGFPLGSFGIFGGWPFSPGLTVPAGEPASGAAADRFNATFWFKAGSTSSSGDGSFMGFYFGNSGGTDRVNSFVIRNVQDVNGGLSLQATETVTPGPSFLSTQTIAANLDRTTWHRIDLNGYFVDSAVDYFTVTLDGSPILNNNNTDPSPNFGTPNFNTWDGYFFNNALPYPQTSRLFFRSGASASLLGLGYTDNNAPQGFYVDDLTYSSFNSLNPSLLLASFDSNSFEPAPEPGSLILLAVGGLCLYARRR